MIVVLKGRCNPLTVMSRATLWHFNPGSPMSLVKAVPRFQKLHTSLPEMESVFGNIFKYMQYLEL